MTNPRPWRVEHVALDAGEAHGADLTGPGATRLVRHHRITRPAIVLGSTQADEHIDRAAAARAGVEVVRRRSGGGAVLLGPGDVVWLDVVIPADDPLWHDDVGVAFEWVGTAWASALAALGARDLEVHRGALVCGRWSSQVCFGGLGPGELTLAGRKVVGLSQRRTRHAARFQCAALLRWDVVGILGLLSLTGSARAEAGEGLAGVAIGLGDAVPGLAGPGAEGAVVDALVAALP